MTITGNITINIQAPEAPPEELGDLTVEIFGETVVGQTLELNYDFDGEEDAPAEFSWTDEGIGSVLSTEPTLTLTDSHYGITPQVDVTVFSGGQQKTATAITSRVGKTYSDDWSDYEIDDTHTDMVANGYVRSSQGQWTAVFVEEATAPSGLAMRYSNTTTAIRFAYPGAVATFTAANVAKTNSYEELFLCRTPVGDLANFYLRPLTNDTTAGNATVSGINIRQRVVKHQVSGEDVASTAGQSLGTLTDGDIFWVRHRVVGAISEVKTWPFDTGEPELWNTREVNPSLVPNAPLFGARSTVGSFDILFWSCGLNEAAPYWAGYEAPPLADGDPLSFAVAVPASSIAIGSGSINFAFAEADVGRYLGGTHYIVNPDPGGGVSIAAITPASVYETLPLFSPKGVFLGDVEGWSHGAMQDYGISGLQTETYPQGAQQAFTSFTQYASLVIGYTHDKNVDPGKTGVPLVIDPGEFRVITKARSLPKASERNSLLSRRGVVVVTPEEPAAGDLPPPLFSPSHTPVFNGIDIDFDTGAELPVTGAPSPAGVLQSVRWHWENLHPARPGADRIVGVFYEPQFRRDAAKNAVDAMLLSATDVDPTVREYLRIWTVISAQDICSALDRGIRFNFPQTDGGVQNGRKSVVVMAAVLTENAWLQSWAERTDWAIEDAYVRYLEPELQALKAAGNPGIKDGFLETDIGVPWWTPGQLAWNLGVVNDYSWRTFWRRSYQEMFHRHMLATHTLTGIFPGYKAAWNNQVMWDYCDRMHYRTLYNGSGEVGLGRKTGGTNNPTIWHRNMFDAYGPGAVWNWS